MIYRLISLIPNYFDQLWSTSPAEGAPWYRLEGAAFNLFAQNIPGTIPLYRCFFSPWGHFLSLDAQCEAAHIPAEGYLGFVWASAQPGSQQLFRCHLILPANRIHFLTTPSTQECAAAGHAMDGPQGWAPY